MLFLLSPSLHAIALATTTLRQRSYAMKKWPFQVFFLAAATAISNVPVRNAG
jgi:hypothetical protein